MKEIYKIQAEYIDKLKRFISQGIKNKSIEDIIYFIDDIELFWRKNIRIIKYFIQINKENLIVHCGSTYLDIDKNEQISYNVSNKLLIIDDIIVKMNVIFRINEYINYSDMYGRLERTINKVFELYSSNLNNNILILPINYIFSATNSNNKEFVRLISDATIDYINSTLDTSYVTLDEWEKEEYVLEDFIHKYKEDKLNNINLVSKCSSFREQFEIYMKDFEIPIEKVLVNKIIGRALYGKMAQIFDIILVAENIGVDIYITNQEVISYLLMIEPIYKEKNDVRKKLIDAMLIYILHQKIEKCKILDNRVAIKCLQESNYLKKAYEIIGEKDFFKLGVEPFIPLIEDTVKLIQL